MLHDMQAGDALNTAGLEREPRKVGDSGGHPRQGHVHRTEVVELNWNHCRDRCYKIKQSAKIDVFCGMRGNQAPSGPPCMKEVDRAISRMFACIVQTRNAIRRVNPETIVFERVSLKPFELFLKFFSRQSLRLRNPMSYCSYRAGSDQTKVRNTWVSDRDPCETSSTAG